MNIRPDILIQSGSYFSFTDPDRATYGIEDIAHSLSNICRFGGHCNYFYSVAQHSVLVSYLVPQDLALEGLLHDAAEAFVGDIPKPLKEMLPDYKLIEDKIDASVRERFELPAVKSPAIKQADLQMLATEQRDLMPDHDDEWAMLEGVEPVEGRITAMLPQQAFGYFMGRYNQLLYGFNNHG